MFAYSIIGAFFIELIFAWPGLGSYAVAAIQSLDTPAPLQPFRFAYNLYWTREMDMSLSTNKVVATRVGLDPGDPRRRLFVIDFDIPSLASEANPPKVDTSCSENALLANTDLFWNGEAKTWRKPAAVADEPI